jgi:PIN domain nuclease of toxin-antitoxin system
VGLFGVILLDTHVVIWLAVEPGRISSRARAAISQARQESEPLAVCDISFLEIAGLVRKDRVAFTIGLEAFFAEVETHFVVLPITARSAARSAALSESFPKDPSDRIIAATALVEGLRLVTADHDLRRHRELGCIW